MILIYVTAFFLLFIFYGIHRYVLDKRYNLPPGPTPIPFLGNSLVFLKCNKNWIIFSQLSKIYGPILTFYAGQYRWIIFNTPKAIQEAIVGQGKFLSDRPQLMMPGFEQLPQGVLFASGSRWQHGRRFCLRALRDFGMGKMAMVEKVHEEVGFFLAELDSRALKPFETRALLSNTVSNVICALVFGKRFDYGDRTFVELMEIMQRIILNPLSRQVAYFAFPPLRFLKEPDLVATTLQLGSRIKANLKLAIDDHRKDFNEDNIRDFPDLFIASELSSDDDSVSMDFTSFSDMMFDMFLAGTETTSTLLNWSLLYLCKYPEVQAKCHETVDRAIGTNRLPVLADRQEMVYIDAVMCELLRITTIVPMAVLHCNLTGGTTVSGYDVPCNSLISYNIWALHNDPEYWSEPGHFIPDRWIGSDGKLLSHSGHFMPFGSGPRICVGEGLARVEYFIYIVALLQRFAFKLADDSVSLDDGIAGGTYSPPVYQLIVSKR